MIEITILELLYLVLTFFLVVVGTLLTLVLLRTLKILAVGVEMANYYWEMKKLFAYYSQVPFVIKDKIFEYITQRGENTVSESEKTEK